MDDEEDNSRGDLMDFLTPRDISTMRYTQHHEWMEEVFNSPYSTGQIVPVELGLGRKGELEALTKDFFKAHTDSTPNKPLPSGSDPPRVGKLEAGKAEDFAKKATEKVAEINTEMERMKQQHAKRMAKLNKGAALKAAERSLRSAPMLAGDSGVDDWKFEELPGSPTIGDAAKPDEGKSVDQINKDVEILLGKKIKVVKELECAQKGGLEEKFENAETDGHDYDLVSPLEPTDGQYNQSALYPTSRDLHVGDRDQVDSINHTPQPSLDVTDHGSGEPEAQGSSEAIAEITSMTEMPDASGSKDLDVGDWVMVDKQHGSSPREEAAPHKNPADVPTAPEDGKATGKPVGTVNDPILTSDVTGNAAEDFPVNAFSETMDFANLDTAGEALSGYDAENVSMGLDEHGDLGLDDSAFGEAFHAAQASPGQPNQRAGL